MEFGNVLLMIEVKSENNDYDKEKTKELKNAYKHYMESYEINRKADLNNNKPKIILAVYSYDSYYKTSNFHYFENGKWQSYQSFEDTIRKF